MNLRIIALVGIIGAVLYYVLTPQGKANLSQFLGQSGGTLPSNTVASGLHAATPFGVYSGGTPFESSLAGFASSLINVFHQQNQAQTAVPGGGTGGNSPGGVSLDSGGNFTSYAGATGATTYAGAIAAEQNPLNAPIRGSGTPVAVVNQGPTLPNQTLQTPGVVAPDVSTPITPDQGTFFSSGFFGTSLDTPPAPQLPTASLSFDSTTGQVNSYFDPTSINYGLPNASPYPDYLSAAAAAPAPVG